MQLVLITSAQTNSISANQGHSFRRFFEMHLRILCKLKVDAISISDCENLDVFISDIRRFLKILFLLSVPSFFDIPLNRILFIPHLIAHVVSPDVLRPLSIDGQMLLLSKVLFNRPDNLSVFLVENTLFLLGNFNPFAQSGGIWLLSRMRNHHGRHKWSILRC